MASLTIGGKLFFLQIFFCPVAHIKQPSLRGKEDKAGFHDIVHELAAHSDLWHLSLFAFFFFSFSSFLLL